jgi:hypothetical protein
MKINIWIFILLTTVIIGFTQFFIPWWSFAILLFVIGSLFIKNPGKSLAFGIIVGTFVWISTAFYQEYDSHVSAAIVIGDLLGGLPKALVFLVTGLIAGVVYGLSAMTGTFLRQLILNLRH